MHKRFEGARTERLRWPGGEIEVVVAEGFRLRLAGLMRLEAGEIEPLLFPRCRSVHTHGMKTSIDLAWLAIEGNQGKVLEVIEALEPGGHARAPRNGGLSRETAALELPARDAGRLGLTGGTEITLADSDLAGLCVPLSHSRRSLD